MILGVKSFHLALRTVLPAAGLLVLIGIVLVCRTDLVLESTSQGPVFTPDGSPPQPRRVSLAVPERSSPGGFAALPPGVTEIPPPRGFAGSKGGTLTSVTAAVSQPPRLDKQLPNISQPGPGPSALGIGGVPIAGQLFPPMRNEPGSDNNDDSSSGVATSNVEASNKRRFERAGKIKTSNLVISNPILDENSPSNPLNKIPTVDLEVARRRAQHPQPLRSHSIIAKFDSPVPSSTEVDEAVQAKGPNDLPDVTLEPIQESHWTASTTSAQPSPGMDEMRRRSPRHPIISALDPMPPPPPLKTPRTMAKSLPPPRPQTQSKPETWDLLSVPRPQLNISATTSSASSTVSKSPSMRDRPATALSLGTMSTSVGPAAKVGQRSRGQSLSSRKSRPHDVAHDTIFTDPRTPPLIPQKISEGSPENRATIGSIRKNIRESPPPPYRANSSKTARMTTAAPSYNAPLAGPSLSLFPAAQSSPVSRPPTRTRAPSVSETTPRPREGTRKSTLEDHKRIQEQSILLLKEIEYSQPIDVNEIVEQYLGKKAPSSPSTIILESVLNRPRPVPRTPEAGHFLQLFKAEPRARLEMQRRRSLSCSSVKTRKSLLHDIPESPAALPALPLMPQQNGGDMRPLLRDARSMTFEEKVAMFFPRSPSSRSGVTKASHRRSSSLIEMPPFEQIGKLVNSQPINDDEAEKRSSRSSMTTVRTHSLFNVPEKSMSRQLSRTSIDPGQYATQDTWQSHAQLEEEPRSLMDIKRQSSPVLPAAGLETPSSMNDIPSPNRNYMTRHESIKSTTKTIIPQATESTENSPASVKTAFPDYDSSEEADFDVQSIPIHAPGLGVMDQWHRRVGDECPTFSHREGQARPRKLTPPRPLALVTSSTRPILIAAEPSPLESPTQALKLIEDQLRKLEQSDQQSAVTEHQRRTLIADLEMEMDVQESQWQMMRRNTIRDSLSTVTTTPSKDTLDNVRLPTLLQTDRYSIRSSLAESRKSGHLQEASHRLEGLNHRSMLSNAGSRASFLTVSHSTGQLGSPTPPDTDESDHEGSMEIRMVLNQIIELAAAPLLWSVRVPSPVVIIASCPKLWSPTLERAADPWFDTYLASQKQRVQPTFRKSTQTPEIETSELWKPVPPSKPQGVARGLWRSTSVLAVGTSPKPNMPVRKPSRKSKRMTELPDIPESPLPLPNRRGTLGVFKFPWGEVSDTAASPGPSYRFPAMPGTMTSGHSLISSFFVDHEQQQGQRLSGRGSSYFDEIEEEEEDAGDNFSDTESDDDFDESTLWEIAGLLQSSHIPSRRSLLPGQWFGEDGTLDSQFLEAESPASPTSPLPSWEATVPLYLDVSTSPLAPVKKPANALWETKSRFYRAATGFGLPQPSRASWASCTASLVSSSEPKKTRRMKPAAAAVGSLWSKPKPTRPSPTLDSGLWTSNENTDMLPTTHTLWRRAPVADAVKPANKPQQSNGLWGIPNNHRSHDDPSSVFSAIQDADVPRQSRRPDATVAPQIASSKLWSSSEVVGRTPAPPSWIHLNTGSANNSAPKKLFSLPRILAPKANWPAALAEANSASSSAPTDPASHTASEKFLWSSLSRQRRAPPLQLESQPHLWVPGSAAQEGGQGEDATPAESAASYPLPLAPPRRRTTSVTSDGGNGDDFIGRGLWSRVEAASRVSWMVKQTDWIARCGV